MSLMLVTENKEQELPIELFIKFSPHRTTNQIMPKSGGLNHTNKLTDAII